MRCPALAGKLETLLNQVNRDHRKGAGKPGQCGDKLPNHTSAEDDHRLVDLQARPADRVQCRSPVNRKRRLFVGQCVVPASEYSRSAEASRSRRRCSAWRGAPWSEPGRPARSP